MVSQRCICETVRGSRRIRIGQRLVGPKPMLGAINQHNAPTSRLCTSFCGGGACLLATRASVAYRSDTADSAQNGVWTHVPINAICGAINGTYRCAYQ